MADAHAYATNCGLTHRETEVLTLVARGLANRQISRMLLINPRTVEKHVENILAKLGARSRTEAAAIYVRNLPPAASPS
ncbi:MAG: transcriptional regulator, LuxR family [Frankiales bacterium]|jgi:DNA-binding NarL/FixJ family response regulator|nr:transcriptional regulator, LuxR family [Frankiales bacterium]